MSGSLSTLSAVSHSQSSGSVSLFSLLGLQQPQHKESIPMLLLGTISSELQKTHDIKIKSPAKVNTQSLTSNIRAHFHALSLLTDEETCSVTGWAIGWREQQPPEENNPAVWYRRTISVIVYAVQCFTWDDINIGSTVGHHEHDRRAWRLPFRLMAGQKILTGVCWPRQRMQNWLEIFWEVFRSFPAAHVKCN